MPLPEEISEGRDYLHFVGMKTLLPIDLQHGYYLFVDRQMLHPDRHSRDPWYKRPSLNFTLAIYDDEARTLYFFQLDT